MTREEKKLGKLLNSTCVCKGQISDLIELVGEDNEELSDQLKMAFACLMDTRRYLLEAVSVGKLSGALN